MTSEFKDALDWLDEQFLTPYRIPKDIGHAAVICRALLIADRLTEASQKNTLFGGNIAKMLREIDNADGGTK